MRIFVKDHILIKNAKYLRFSCKAGSLMEGSAVAYCDGKEWNGTKPECLGELDQVIMTSALKCQSSQCWHFATIFIKFILLKLF